MGNGRGSVKRVRCEVEWLRLRDLATECACLKSERILINY